MSESSPIDPEPIPSVSASSRHRGHYSELRDLHLKAELCSAASLIFAVPPERLASSHRCAAPIASARQTAMYLAHVAHRLPQRAVGQIFGRDRKTVAHACARIEDRRDDPQFDRAIAWIEFGVRLGARGGQSFSGGPVHQ